MSDPKDPRRPDAVIPFKLTKAKQKESFDVFNSLSFVMAIFGMFYRNRYAAWLSVITGIIYTLNQKYTDKEKDGSALGNPIIVGISALLVNYIQIFLPPPHIVAQRAATATASASPSP